MTQRHDARGRFTFSKETPPTANHESLKLDTVKKKTASRRKPKKITIKARGGIYEIPTNHITEDTRYVYQNGQCFALAIVLAEKNNTDVGLLVQVNDIPWGTRYEDTKLKLNLDHDWFKDTIHAVALTEDSTEYDTLTMDIGGARDMAGVKAEFEDVHYGTLIRIKPVDLRFLLLKKRKGTGFFEPDYTSAELIAPLIPLD